MRMHTRLCRADRGARGSMRVHTWLCRADRGVRGSEVACGCIRGCVELPGMREGACGGTHDIARDPWWPALVRASLHQRKQRAATCHVKAFWLDPSPHSPRSYQLNATLVTVRFQSLLRGEAGKPMFILAEETLSASCHSDGIVTYKLDDEGICHLADELAGVWETAGGLLDVAGMSNSDSDESDKVAARTARREIAQETAWFTQ
eukprot:36251-Prorocentrum_minimum.AAC.1